MKLFDRASTMSYLRICCCIAVLVNFSGPATAQVDWVESSGAAPRAAPVAPAGPSAASQTIAGAQGTGGSLFDFGSVSSTSRASGGAPTPEANALLSLMLASGTAAFVLRRRRSMPERKAG